MQHVTRRWTHYWVMALAVLGLAGMLASVSNPAQAAPKSKKSEGKFLAFDAEAKTMKVKVKGKEVEFHVVPTGSVLTRTTVTINGKKAEFTDLPRMHR